MSLGRTSLGRQSLGRKGGSSATALVAGLASETDSALAVTLVAGARLTVGTAAETDSALAASTTSGARVVAGLASETNTAQGVNVTDVTPITLAAGIAAETDTARPVTLVAGAQLAAGIASETDAALPTVTTAAARITAGIAAEADSALALLALNLWPVGIAAETDTSLTVVVDAGLNVTRPAGLVTEIDHAEGVYVVVSNLPHVADISNRADGIEIEVDADASWEPPVTAISASSGQSELVVVVVDSYDRTDGVPRPVTRSVSRPRERIRIRVAGADWTNRDGIPALVPEVQFQMPLGYGPGTWRVPQFAPLSDDEIGVGEFKRIKEQKPVALDLIDEWPASGTYGQVTRKGFWRGFIQALEADDAADYGLDVELAGQAHGRAVMEWHAEPLIRRVRDAGVHLWNSIVGKLNQRMQPRIPHIGINLSNRGGSFEDEYLNDQLHLMVDRDTGAQWTVMPDDDGIYRAIVKDYETVHFTVYRDGQLNKGVRNTDLAERLNVIYADAVGPDGHRINFAMAPRMLPGSIPPYPFEDGRTFGIGTTDEPGHPTGGGDDEVSTDDGRGVTALIWRLTFLGKLHRRDLPGGYDEDVYQAVVELKEQAKMLPATGNVTEVFWNTILWDNLVSGYSDEWTHVRPAVQRTKTEKFLRSGSGAITGRNPDYDPHEIVRAASFGMGQVPSTRQVIRAARGEMAPVNVRDWIVQYTLDGGLIDGEHNPGDPVDATMLRNPILAQPGTNLWDPWLDGGRLLQVGHSQLSKDGKSVQIMASTRAYDGAKIWEIWDRSRETRDNLARGRGKARASSMRQDNVAPWDRWSGQTDRDWDLVAGWNLVVVPSGGAGTLNDISIVLAKPERFAMAVLTQKPPMARFARKLHPLQQPPVDPQHHLITVSGEPRGGTFTLVNDGADETPAIAHDATAGVVQAAVRTLGGFGSATVRGPAGGPWRVTMHGGPADIDLGSNDLNHPSDASVSVTSAGPTTGDGTPWYGQDDNAAMLKKYGVIYTAGQWNQACGFGNYVENDGAVDDDGEPVQTSEPVSGKHFDSAGVEYEADHNALYLVVYLPEDAEDNKLPRQQVFEQQLAGV